MNGNKILELEASLSARVMPSGAKARRWGMCNNPFHPGIMGGIVFPAGVAEMIHG